MLAVITAPPQFLGERLKPLELKRYAAALPEPGTPPRSLNRAIQPLSRYG
jgi:hypothetical protein